MGGVLAAYLATLGIVSYRWLSGPRQAPPPVTIAAAGGVFAAVGIAAHADQRLGNALGWAVVIGAVFAPRSTLEPVREAFAPEHVTGGPARHSLGDPNTVKPKKGQVYYKIIAGGRYAIVNSAGKRIPGEKIWDRPPPGITMYPSAGAQTGTA